MNLIGLVYHMNQILHPGHVVPVISGISLDKVRPPCPRTPPSCHVCQNKFSPNPYVSLKHTPSLPVRDNFLVVP